jgi:hypothetical protein
MRASPYSIAVFLWFCVGCDPAVHTHLSVTPAITGSPHQPDEVVSLVCPVLQTNGLGEFRTTNQPPASAVTFTDWYAGGNPHIWVAISHEGWPVSVDFMERWTSHRSHKHKRLVREVQATLKQHEFQVER